MTKQNGPVERRIRTMDAGPGETFEQRGQAKPNKPVTPPKRPAGSKPPTAQAQVAQQNQRHADSE